MTSQIFLAALTFIYLHGIPWSCTQSRVLSNFNSSIAILLSYFCMITRCLSKLQDSALRTISTSEALPKMNRITWSLRFQTLNQLLDCQSRVNVLAIASMLRARFVRNFTAMICSWELRSLSKQQPSPSLLESISFVQFCVIPSIVDRKEFVNKD